MVQSLIGKKIDQAQGFLEDGTRVPLSIISVRGNVVTQIKTTEREGYNSVQLGFGSTKKTAKPLLGHIKKAGIEKMPRFFREVRADAPSQELGSEINVLEVFEPGDIVDVTGTSKGKGFAGVVKRHHFKGGPRTHGQSDRERAPGSIGQTTTPGRVYKGKRMAGKMGNEQVTIKNLEVLDVKEDIILVRGLIPGAKGSIVTIRKVGKSKKFKPLWSEKSEDSENSGNQAVSVSEDQKAEAEAQSAVVEGSVKPKEESKNAS
jgi:large subunit ribosomal protein L3